MSNILTLVTVVIVLLLSCKTRDNALDHREGQPDPVTPADLLAAERFTCESAGKTWIEDRRVCVVPAVACADQPGHFFDHQKDICLGPRDLCLAESDGSEWVDGECLSAQEVCASHRDGSIWNGNACVRSKEACLAASDHWVWNEQENRCRLLGFLEYCRDQDASAAIRYTVQAIRHLIPNKIMSCTEAWEYAYYQKTIRLEAPFPEAEGPGRITDLYPLADLGELRELVIVGHPVRDLLPLAHLQHLESLTISSSSGLSDLSGLEQAKSLRSLTLTDNAISRVKALGKLTDLTSLDLSGNSITTLEPLRQLEALEHLRLARNPIRTAYYLRTLVKLQSVDLDGTPLSESVTKTPSNCPRGKDVALALDRFCAQTKF